MSQKHVTFLHRLEYAGFLLVAFVFRTLPVEAASGLSGWIWRHVAPRIRRHARAVANLRAAFPEKSEAECEIIARDMWEGLGRVFAEAFQLERIVAQGRVTMDPACLKLLPADGRLVAAAPHQANWEVGAAALRAFGGVGGGVYQRLKNPLVDAYVRSLRASLYPGGLWPKQSDAARIALRHLRNGGVLTIMADLRDGTGIQTPFFGRLAPTSPFPALAARVTGAPLFTAEIVREPGVRFRVSLTPIPVPCTENRDADIAAATSALHAQFEASIRRHPEQWMWVHRRWG